MNKAKVFIDGNEIGTASHIEFLKKGFDKLTEHANLCAKASYSFVVAIKDCIFSQPEFKKFMFKKSKKWNRKRFNKRLKRYFKMVSESTGKEKK